VPLRPLECSESAILTSFGSPSSQLVVTIFSLHIRMSGGRSWFFYPNLSTLKRSDKKSFVVGDGNVIIFR
jgi:hypothetical protein